MSEKKKPRLLILEKDESIRNQAFKALEQSGWEVVCRDVSKEALLELDQSKASPFALFISSYKLPLMEGDNILKKARSISPMTQRMLLVPADHSDILIRAINKAGIHACITYPFTDTDLVERARTCFEQFSRAMKRSRLKRVTVHQNKQMFTIAQKLKKKDEALKSQINEKKAQKMMLEKDLPQEALSLSAILDRHEVPATRESFEKHFFRVKKFIQSSFNQAADQGGLDPVTPGNLSPISQIGGLVAEPVSREDPENEPTPQDTGQRGVIRHILETAIPLLDHPDFAGTASGSGDLEPDNIDQDMEPEQESELGLNKTVQVSISQDRIQALIKKIKPPEPSDPLTLESLLDLLRDKGVTYGIIEDQKLESWIKEGALGEEILAAQGSEPDPGRNASIQYHFETAYTNPGKILDDGSIDFRQRGDIPFVRKGDLLAVKSPCRKALPGINIAGEPIPVEEVEDPELLAEANTTLSEDGLSLYAALDGQPHLDALGNVTVNPELVIDGDVDFETGNIDFKGNILVKGAVKEGFVIKGVSLTAQEIEGSRVDITGDLCVSSGITDAKISAQGNIHAKFINQCEIGCFGDLVIQKEIIDSSIAVSGAVENSSGHIITSKIAAKAGIEAGNVGTDASKPATLKVGVDEHADHLIQQIDRALEESKTRLKDMKEKIKTIEEQDQDLYGLITQKAQEQEQARNEIKNLKDAMADMKQKSDMAGIAKAKAAVNKLSRTADEAEKELDRIFTVQDESAKQIDNLKQAVERIELANKKKVLDKKQIGKYSSDTQALARIDIHKTLIQGTLVQGPNASLSPRENLSRCRIEEILVQTEGQQYHEMGISDL